MSIRLANHSYAAAHPRVAGALAALGRNFADSAQPIAEHPVFIVVGLIAACGLLWARAQGLVS